MTLPRCKHFTGDAAKNVCKGSNGVFVTFSTSIYAPNKRSIKPKKCSANENINQNVRNVPRLIRTFSGPESGAEKLEKSRFKNCFSGDNVKVNKHFCGYTMTIRENGFMSPRQYFRFLYLRPTHFETSMRSVHAKVNKSTLLSFSETIKRFLFFFVGNVIIEL